MRMSYGGDAGSASLEELNVIGIKEVLEQDPRPTFVLDLDPDLIEPVVPEVTLNPLFCNEALRTHHVLLDTILGDRDDSSHPDSRDDNDSTGFRNWATSVTKFDDTKDVFPLTYLYQNLLWTGSTVRKRWRLISGNQCYQVPGVPLKDLSAGLPGEVATGSSALKRSLQREPSELAQSGKDTTRTVGFQMIDSTININNGDETSPDNTTNRPQVLKARPSVSSYRSSTGTAKTRSTRSLLLGAPEKATPDWTAKKPKGILSEHLLFTRSMDWASTPLGSMSTWSRELRQMANMVMSNPHPCALFWGSELTLLYNEAYRVETAGNKHPALMGTGAEGPFSELWEVLEPLFVECARTGKSVRRENDLLPVFRHGYLEESYFSWSFTPIYGGTSNILGFYNAPFETTAHCIGQRRMHTLQHLGQVLTPAKTVKEFWKCMLNGLEDNQFDIPFALLYSVMDSDDGDEASVASGSTISLKSCVFEGSIGVPLGHPAAPDKLDLKRSREGFIPSFREAMRTREPTKLMVRDGTLPESLLEGIEWRGHGDPCNEAIIFPVRPTNGESVMAFLLMGVNPRRAYDADYKAFTTIMNRQLATSLASVMLFEDEMRRSHKAIVAAALEQEHLNEQLAVQTNRLQRMTELSPLGMYYINPEGLILEANDRYLEMTSQDRDTLRPMSWENHLSEESKEVALEGWRRLTVEHLPWSAELKLNKKQTDFDTPHAEVIDCWVLANSYPELTPDGDLRSVMGSITDISHLKWAQGLQDRRLREAEETRRQQNEFIDITSHEMRNPLSAILQCADDIAATMVECQAKEISSIAPMIENCIEAATTIALCVRHQKSIVDDILTVSKLDSNLLVLTPIAAQPVLVARRAVRMFDSELSAKNIKLEFSVDPSFDEFGIDWVSMDPSRMSQVVINLMTNAIKFTSECKERKITVAIGASKKIPMPTRTPDFEYIPRKNAMSSSALGEDWNTGETIYIRLKVEDTGCGLTPTEMQLLFQRFQQASPRTHAQYGGSGLGLFISRQLTELHGGQIGVASEANVGSTFGFYIRTRKIASPAQRMSGSVRPPEHAWSGVGDLGKISATSQEVLTLPGEASAVNSLNTQEQVFEPSNLYILVVEDNLVNQRVLVKQLRKAGITVDAADNGQKALDFLETTEFMKESGRKLSVVLMDLEMPVMDGLTCVRNIRRMEIEAVIKGHVPVIAVTANVRHEQVTTAKEAGMDDVVSKPFRIPDLLIKVRQLLSGLGSEM